MLFVTGMSVGLRPSWWTELGKYMDVYVCTHTDTNIYVAIILVHFSVVYVYTRCDQMVNV